MNLTSLVVRRLAGSLAPRSIILGGVLAASVMVLPALAQTTQPAAPAQGTPAVPAEQIPVNIGILDSARVSNTSTVGKSLNDQVNAVLNQIESDYRKKEQTLQKQMQQLVAARSGNPPMTPADFEVKRKALVTQDQQLQENYDKSKKALGVRVDKARTKIGETLQKIVVDIATQRRLTLVLERTAAHLFVPQWDITQDVMTRLNKALPSIKL